MLQLSQIPQWLQSGDFYTTIASTMADEDADFTMIRPLKTDFVFSGLRDILELLDTALYMGIERLPVEVYTYCCNTPELLIEMDLLAKNEGELTNYQYFTTTPEYAAFRICIESKMSIRDTDIEYTLLYDAIKYGNMPLVEYCTEYRGACTMDSLHTAIKYKQIAICKYIVEKYPDWRTSIQMSWGLIDLAVTNGDLPMLRYLVEVVGVIWFENVLQHAILKNQTDCAIYAIKSGCPIPKYAVDFAIDNDNIDIVSALIDRDIVVDNPYVLNYALQLGNIVIAKMLYANGARPNQNTMCCACGNEACELFAAEISA
jgi:hypothetical protein